MSYVIYKGQKYNIKNEILDLRDKGIRDILEIEGLENLTNLQRLDLNDNQISEIRGLEKLINLKELYLWNNQINEIKGLEDLTNLLRLDLGSNQISEIKGLEKLINLQELYLWNNQITEIKSLEYLINLQELYLWNNQITEIKGLENLTNLQGLYLGNNQITEIKGLENLNNLRWLYLNNNKISEIKGLETLINLQKLYLTKNPIKNEIGYLLYKTPQEVIKYCNEIKKRFEFDFAFSFAGEDREIIKKIAEKIKNRGVKVFYDDFYKADLLGKDLALTFKEIYGKKSKYVVLFVSKHYEKKVWTNFEFEIARNAIQSRSEDYILPVRLNDTILFGLKETIGYIDYKKEGCDATVNILIQKLKKSKNMLDSSHEINDFKVQEWINTDRNKIKIGLTFPVDNQIVNSDVISAYGQIKGLAEDVKNCFITGFVITNKEFEQSSSRIDENNFWKIDQIHLGATNHLLFFRIYDNLNNLIAESKRIRVKKIL